MSKDRKKLQHIHSSVIDKQPTPASLEVGEIAVNNAEGKEFLSIKNSNVNNPKVVRFSSDEQIMTWTEKKEVIPYSGTVDNIHLDTNRSNIEIKMNQVVAGNTMKHDAVNGARDIDGDLVNPTTDGGLTDGAGFAIDMSIYAMQGANPEFSSITTTCNATLNGTTTIQGTDDECGSLLKINVASADTLIGDATTVISGNTDLTVSGTTTETKEGDVVENNLGNKTEATSGDQILNVSGDTVVTSDGNICETAGVNATLYGIEKTNIGLNCNESDSSTITNVYGDTINVIGETANTIVESDNVSATTTIYSGDSLTITENRTEITSCELFKVKGDDIKFEQCDGSEGSVDFKFCDGFNVDSNAVTIEECTDGGTLVVKESTVELSGTTNNNVFDVINTSANAEQHNITSFTVNGTDVCIVSTNKAAIGGDLETNVGANCEGELISDVTNIYGDVLNESGTTNNNIFDTINNNVTTFNISGDTNITGDTYISGDITIGTQCNQLSSNTIADSFCEVFDRSKVTMTRVDDPSDTRLSAIYRIWQDGSQIGYDINVPKDGFLKDVELVDVDGIYKLRFTWNIYDADTGTYRTGTTDVSVEDIVKDIEANNDQANRGVDVNVWYNPTTKKMNVSADTNIQIVTPNGTSAFTKNNAVHSLNSYKLTVSSGDVRSNAALTNAEFDPFKVSTAITIPTSVSHINRGKLTIQENGTPIKTYDPASDETINIPVPTSVSGLTRGTFTIKHNGLTTTYDPSGSTNVTLPHSGLTITYGATSGKSGTFTYDTSGSASAFIPTCVSHLNRRTLKWVLGKPSASTVNYDPGNAACGGDDTFTIPSSLEHLTNWTANCLQINNNICVSGTVTSQLGMYTASDISIKDNIMSIDDNDIEKAKNVDLKSFTYKNDSDDKKKYGVIAQEVQEAGLDNLVSVNADGKLSVDYTSLLILKIAELEKQINILTEKLEKA